MNKKMEQFQADLMEAVRDMKKGWAARSHRVMARMFNPPHPGKVLREYLGDFTITDAASRLKVTRTTLSGPAHEREKIVR